MKKLLIALALLIGTSATAQEKDVTKFLGIPVDGFKSEMIQKLKEKGFVATSENDTLEGEFNGTDVYVIPVTNNNKVYRIAVFDKYYKDETGIRIRFNKLCNQFENNSRYMRVSDLSTISETEDISYNITVNKKRYEVTYYQVSENGTPCFHKNVWFMIDDKYGQYRIIMFYDNLLNQANGEDL